MFKTLFQDGFPTVSVMNVGNDCVMRSASPVGESITFIPRMNIDCECDPPKLKVTGLTANDSHSYTFTDENVMIGEFTKIMIEKQKEAEVQEVK